MERFALGTPVYGSNGPGHTDAQENIDSITARHVTNGGVSILVLDGSDFAGKSVCAKEKPNESMVRLTRLSFELQALVIV